jgi:hypothetical protein
MGNSIYSELNIQNRILGDLDAGVDDTQGRLTSVMRRVNKLLESTSGMCCSEAGRKGREEGRREGEVN